MLSAQEALTPRTTEAIAESIIDGPTPIGHHQAVEAGHYIKVDSFTESIPSQTLPDKAALECLNTDYVDPQPLTSDVAEPDVELRKRLDDLQRKLDRADSMLMNQMYRIPDMDSVWYQGHLSLMMSYEKLLISSHQQTQRWAFERELFIDVWTKGIRPILLVLWKRRPSYNSQMRDVCQNGCGVFIKLLEKLPNLKAYWFENLGDILFFWHKSTTGGNKIIKLEECLRFWSAASRVAPTLGRLYCNIARASPSLPLIEQLVVLAKALCAEIPDPSGTAQKMTRELFHRSSQPENQAVQSVENSFTMVHSTFYMDPGWSGVDYDERRFIMLLESCDWNDCGYRMAIVNATALLGFGLPVGDETPTSRIRLWYFVGHTLNAMLTILEKKPNLHSLQFVHVTLVFVCSQISVSASRTQLRDTFPWDRVALLLNKMLKNSAIEDTPCKEDIPTTPVQPLQEDLQMRGLSWVHSYHPEVLQWEGEVDPDISMKRTVGRILGLGHVASSSGYLLKFDAVGGVFAADSMWESRDRI